jgi:hypothetical protein
METLLNLAWLLLVLPAWHLWRSSRAGGKKLKSLQALLALTCVLVILFPVVSATDDLHAMRAEIEESPSSKRSVRLAGGDRGFAWNLRLQTAPALLENPSTLIPAFEYSSLPHAQSSCLPIAPAVDRSGRAPPLCLL